MNITNKSIAKKKAAKLLSLLQRVIRGRWLAVEAICLVFIGQNLAIIYLVCYNIFVIKILWYIASI